MRNSRLLKPLAESMTNSKNHQWKGDNVQYVAIHDWVYRRLTKPTSCQDCGKAKPLDLANISQEYKRDLDDWEWLCRSCHMKKDGRITELHNKCHNPASYAKCQATKQARYTPKQISDSIKRGLKKSKEDVYL